MVHETAVCHQGQNNPQSSLHHANRERFSLTQILHYDDALGSVTNAQCEHRLAGEWGCEGNDS